MLSIMTKNIFSIMTSAREIIYAKILKQMAFNS